MRNFIEIDLVNKMKAYYIHMPNTHSVVISIYVRAGLAYEDPKHFGVSHLIEHLLFRRLDDLEQRQLYYELECLGTTLRATTYADFIRFYAEVHPHFADKAFQIIEKIFHGGNWTFDDIGKEKKVVLNQINSKSLSFLDRSNLEYWAHSPFGNEIMGTVSKIDRISIATILRYYEKFFRPQNSAIVISGNFHEGFEQLTQNTLCKLETKNGPGLPVLPIFPQNFGERSIKDDIIFETDGEYADVRICFEAKHQMISKESVQFLHSILGDGDGSRLSLLLREDLGIVDEIYTDFELHNEFSILSIQYDVTCDMLLESLELVYSVIFDMIHKISDKDINTSVHFFTSNSEFDLDSPETLNFYYGWRSFIMGEPITQPEERFALFNRQSADELKKTALSLFTSANMSTFVYCNQNLVKHNKIARQLKKARSLLGSTCISLAKSE